MDNFPPIQLNWSCRFLSFFGILAWVFSRFCLSFELFHEFLGICPKNAGIFELLKIFDDKKAVFRCTFKFPLKMEFLFSLSPIKLNISCEFLSFLGILLEFFQDFPWVLSFLGLRFFRNVQNSAWLCSSTFFKSFFRQEIEILRGDKGSLFWIIYCSRGLYVHTYCLRGRGSQR